MTDISHEELMMQVQRGSLAAFELLFERFRGPVFNFLFRMLNGERGAAEDLLQEVFVKIYDARKDYEPKARFSTWLFTIARNHCLNYLKSRSTRQGCLTISLEALAQETPGKPAMDRLPEISASNDAKGADMRELLEQAIAGLPDEYKEVFVLHAVEGFSHEEVARILKTKPATVRTHYHRARQALRDIIGKQLKPVDGTSPTRARITP